MNKTIDEINKTIDELIDNFNHKHAYSFLAFALVGVVCSYFVYFVAYNDPQPMLISQHIWRVVLVVISYFFGGFFFSKDQWN